MALDEISLVPPQIVADNAARGLALRAKFGRGGTETGVGRAQELVARRALQPSTIRRMVSFFARHEVDKRAQNFGNEQNPSAGYVAWPPRFRHPRAEARAQRRAEVPGIHAAPPKLPLRRRKSLSHHSVDEIRNRPAPTY